MPITIGERYFFIWLFSSDSGDMVFDRVAPQDVQWYFKKKKKANHTHDYTMICTLEGRCSHCVHFKAFKGLELVHRETNCSKVERLCLRFLFWGDAVCAHKQGRSHNGNVFAYSLSRKPFLPCHFHPPTSRCFPAHCLCHPWSSKRIAQGFDLLVPLKKRNPSFLPALPSQKTLFLPHWAPSSLTYITHL